MEWFNRCVVSYYYLKKNFFYLVSEVISLVNQEKKIDAARNDNVKLMTEWLFQAQNESLLRQEPLAYLFCGY